MWICKCGSSCSDEARFCMKCGGERAEAKGDGRTEWFYSDGDKRVGPLTAEQMKAAMKRGEVEQDTPVWRKGYFGWKSAGDTELKEYLSQYVPPVPPKSLSDKWLWSLATVPLLVDFFLRIAFPYEYFNEPMVFSVIILALNSLFLVLDTSYLKKMGYSVHRWMFLGLLILPVYLIVRPSKTTKNYIPLVFWVILWLLPFFPVW